MSGSKLGKVALVLAIVSGHAGCGESKTISLTFSDSVSTSPHFVVTLQSDESSHFTQNQVPGQTLSGALVYYYGTDTRNLKNCAVATSQVDFNASYHTGSPSASDCSNFVTDLNSLALFPLSASDLIQGSDLDVVSPGYSYILFFYNPTSSTSSLGIDVAAGQTITSSNRCVKIWAARVENRTLVRGDGGAATAPVDLSALKCFGF